MSMLSSAYGNICICHLNQIYGWNKDFVISQYSIYFGDPNQKWSQTGRMVSQITENFSILLKAISN